MKTPTIQPDRYFIVVYLASFRRGTSTGTTCFTVTNGGYLNSDKTCQMIKERNKDANFDTVIVTNILELNQSDYEAWMATE